MNNDEPLRTILEAITGPVVHAPDPCDGRDVPPAASAAEPQSGQSDVDGASAAMCADSLSFDDVRPLRQIWTALRSALDDATPRVDRGAIVRGVIAIETARRRRVQSLVALAASLVLACGAGAWRLWPNAGQTVAQPTAATATPAVARHSPVPLPAIRPDAAWDDQLDRRLSQMQKRLRRAPIAEARASSRFSSLQHRIDNFERDLRSSTL